MFCSFKNNKDKDQTWQLVANDAALIDVRTQSISCTWH